MSKVGLGQLIWTFTLWGTAGILSLLCSFLIGYARSRTRRRR